MFELLFSTKGLKAITGILHDAWMLNTYYPLLGYAVGLHIRAIRCCWRHDTRRSADHNDYLRIFIADVLSSAVVAEQDRELASTKYSKKH